MKKILFSKKTIILLAVLLVAASFSVWINISTSNRIVDDKKMDISEKNVVRINEGIPEKKSIIHLSKRAQKLAEVEISPVEYKAVTIKTYMYGIVDYDETRIGYVTAWMPGRIDGLYVDFMGREVEEGQVMASIYSPELVTAQAELIEAKRYFKKLTKTNLKLIKKSSSETESAAREKLRLLGIRQDQIEDIIENETPYDHLTLFAPIGGTVVHLNVREGVYVETGTQLFKIVDLSTVWVMCDAYESDLIWIKKGLEINFEVEALPGETFSGKITYIDPILDQKTRIARVRIEVPNNDRRLKPGMFVNAVQQKKINESPPLVIPASAPLITGKRAVVYIAVPGEEGKYEGRDVILGPKAGNYYIVKEGLKEGELVVTHGNFKIDSAMQIEAKPSMMNPLGQQEGIESDLPSEIP